MRCSLTSSDSIGSWQHFGGNRDSSRADFSNICRRQATSRWCPQGARMMAPSISSLQMTQRGSGSGPGSSSASTRSLSDKYSREDLSELDVRLQREFAVEESGDNELEEWPARCRLCELVSQWRAQTFRRRNESYLRPLDMSGSGLGAEVQWPADDAWACRSRNTLLHKIRQQCGRGDVISRSYVFLLWIGALGGGSLPSERATAMRWS